MVVIGMNAVFFPVFLTGQSNILVCFEIIITSMSKSTKYIE